ncbi:hypothetical protein OAT67_02350 [Bacteriovoracaceae bacterium]|nr:hypothetical protein [Bacteriovoracaceae bacterium]
MKTNKKKSPSDYPMFSFRVSEDDKEMLNIQIEKAVKLLNKKLDEDDRAIRKNDVIVKALNIGLKEVIKKKKL